MIKIMKAIKRNSFLLLQILEIIQLEYYPNICNIFITNEKYFKGSRHKELKGLR